MAKIKFGTDGWRAIMCDEFIFHNVKIVVQAIANYLKKSGKAEQGIFIGYDSRFFSDRFGRLSAEVLAANSIPVKISKTDIPTPVLAFSLSRVPSAGGIIFTASHNPPIYNGIKFIPEHAAPALPEVTEAIEKELSALGDAEIKTLPFEEAKRQHIVSTFDPFHPYIEQINSLIDVEQIKAARLKIVYDALHGEGRNYLPAILSPLCDLKTMHCTSDPYFGGLTPEPIARNLQELSEAVKDKAHLGLANDGDADRFGVVDFDGTYINANQVLSLLLYHLIKNRGMKGPVARTVATTHLLDEIARSYDLPTIETPVGFKFIGHKILEEGAILGGEESGGMSIKGHIPEKDGILALCLITELRAMEGKALKVLLEELSRKYGEFISKRLDIHCSEDEKIGLFTTLRENPPDFLGGLKVIEQKSIDGMKFILEDGSWVLFRPSGTENLVRIYIEAKSNEKLLPIEQSATSFFSASSKR